MPFDALTMTAVADELRTLCVGGRIQAVFLPAPLAIGLEVYANRHTYYLFASAHPQHARIHLTQNKLSRGSDDVTPLLLLLRKYVRDGRLAAVEQPPLERTLSLIITKASPFDKGIAPHQDIAQRTTVPALPDGEGALTLAAYEGEGWDEGGNSKTRHITTVKLIIEVMGRYSNIILIDAAGLVLEAVKHVPAELNRYRVTLPRHPYVPPPPQNKSDPRGLSTATLSHVLQVSTDQPAWQTLVRTYRGISPLLAREAVYRAIGQTDALAGLVPAEALATALSALLSGQYTHHWTPSLARSDDTILEFAPYQLTQYGAHMCPQDSISAAIQAYYAQETVASDYAGLKQVVQKALATERERVIRRKQSLEVQQAASADADTLRLKGELLLGYAAQIGPGQSEVVLEFSPDHPPMHIALDPHLSAVENAQAYFRRYTQARDSARALPPLLERADLDLAYLDQLALDLDLADTPDTVRDVQRALSEIGSEKAETGKKGQRPAPMGKKLAPLTVTSVDGMEIIVGRNARQNDYVTFEIASATDLWLHARGVAGSHVIVRTSGHRAPQATIEQAASLAATFSAARESTTVTVDYTERRNVRRIKGAGPGLVTYTGEKTIHVRPRGDPKHASRTR